MSRAILLHPHDTVATLLDRVQAGGDITLSDGRVIRAAEDIPIYFKIAIQPMERGVDVMKYGQTIGRAIDRIAIGEMVHTHNLVSNRAQVSCN